jgi:hypothetical protein
VDSEQLSAWKETGMRKVYGGYGMCVTCGVYMMCVVCIVCVVYV